MTEEKKPGPLRWFVGKLLRAPAAWVGLGTAAFVSYSAATTTMPIGGALSFGAIVGLAIGAFAFLISSGISASHRKAMNADSEGSADASEMRMLEEMRRADLSRDSDILEKLVEERKAIALRAREQEENADLNHTYRLVGAIVREAFGRSEELQDLARRIEDPILDIPKGAEATVEEIRQQWADAYRAVVDARTRLRKGESLQNIEFLDESTKSRSLAELTARLNEETQIAERVQDRVVSDSKGVSNPEADIPESRIVLEDEIEGGEGRAKESE